MIPKNLKITEISELIYENDLDELIEEFEVKRFLRKPKKIFSYTTDVVDHFIHTYSLDKNEYEDSEQMFEDILEIAKREYLNEKVFVEYYKNWDELNKIGTSKFTPKMNDLKDVEENYLASKRFYDSFKKAYNQLKYNQLEFEFMSYCLQNNLL